MHVVKIWQQLAVLSLGLASSVLAPEFIESQLGPSFTAGDQFILGTAVFVAFLLFDVILIQSSILQVRLGEFKIWNLQDQADLELTKIRHHFSKLAKEAHGPNDLFVSYFMKDIRNLEENIENASEVKQMRIKDDYFLNVEGVFDAFYGAEEKTLKYTWPIAKGEVLFANLSWKRFFEVSIAMLHNKRITAIQVLMVVESLDDVRTDVSSLGNRMSTLLCFFKALGISCKFISRATLNSICDQNGIEKGYLDFGLYGKRMLFRSEKYEPEYIGIYSKDQWVIEQYTRLFDTIWKAESVVLETPVARTQPVTLAKLFEVDAGESPSTQSGKHSVAPSGKSSTPPQGKSLNTP